MQLVFEFGMPFGTIPSFKSQATWVPSAVLCPFDFFSMYTFWFALFLLCLVFSPVSL
jgi:hypothetical protein